MRALAVAIAALAVLASCDRPDRRDTPARAASEPRSTLGLPADELAALRWIQGDGVRAWERLGEGCGEILGCLDDGAELRACLEPAVATCAGGVAHVEAQTIPEPFVAAYGSLVQQRRYDLCVGRAVLAALERDPGLGRRVAGGLDEWAYEHRDRSRTARELNEAFNACGDDGVIGSRWGDVATWLRARVCCGRRGQCSIQKLANMANEGEDVTPRGTCG